MSYRIRKGPEPDHPPRRTRSRPEPRKPNMPLGIKSMPEPTDEDVPPRPGPEVPTTVKGNYPPGHTLLGKMSPPSPRQNPGTDRERGTPRTMGGSIDVTACLLLSIVIPLLVLLVVLSL